MSSTRDQQAFWGDQLPPVSE